MGGGGKREGEGEGVERLCLHTCVCVRAKEIEDKSEQCNAKLGFLYFVMFQV